jgi:hypothetical protein
MTFLCKRADLCYRGWERNPEVSSFYPLSCPRWLISRIKEIPSLLYTHQTLPLFKISELEATRFIVVVQGVVTTDGSGDFFEMLIAAQKIKKAYPLSTIRLVIGIIEFDNRKRNFPREVDAFPFAELYVYGALFIYSNRVSFEPGQEDLYESYLFKIQEADVSLVAFHVDNFATIQYDNAYRMVEYGMYERPFPAITMGVSPLHSGLLILDPLCDEEKSFRKLSLFLQEFFIREPETFSAPENKLSFCYMSESIRRVEFFLSTLVACEEDLYLDFVMNMDSLPFLYFDFLNSKGVKSVELFKKSEEGALVSVSILNISDTGKVIRIINPFPLLNQDIQILMANSFCVGCRGDVTLSEAREKLYDYEIADFKRDFFGDLIKLAEDYLGEESCFARYLRLLQSRHPRDISMELVTAIGLLKANPVTHLEAKRFYEFLRENYDFTSALISIVARQYMFKTRPKLKEFCDAQLEEASGKIDSISHLVEQLRSRLDSL